MKRGFVILVCVLVIFVIATVETVLVNNAFVELGEKYATLAPVLERNQENTAAEECVDKVDELTDLWTRRKKLFSIYIPHNSLVELNLKVTRLAATVKCDDYKMATIELEDLINTFPEYNTRYFPTIYNIL